MQLLHAEVLGKRERDEGCWQRAAEQRAEGTGG